MNKAVANTVIYHNPRCSKLRQTLELMSGMGIQPIVIEYLKTPPDTQTLKSILSQLNISARELLRTQESEYAELGLANKTLSEDELIQAMTTHPILIERPIVIAGERVAIGRPPERVLEILKP